MCVHDCITQVRNPLSQTHATGSLGFVKECGAYIHNTISRVCDQHITSAAKHIYTNWK